MRRPVTPLGHDVFSLASLPAAGHTIQEEHRED